MKQGYLEALDGHRAEIKRTWEVLLRVAPATTPLGNPDTLVFLMDESIGQLFSLLRSKTAHQWLSLHPPATVTPLPGNVPNGDDRRSNR